MDDRPSNMQAYRDALAAALGTGEVVIAPFFRQGPPYLCSVEVPVNCPYCGHAVNRHDPEDGTCDVHRDVGLGPCQCPGLRRETLADEITAQGEAAHAEEGAELVAVALAAWRKCRAAGLVPDDPPDPEVRELTAALDELAAWELT